MVAPPPPSTAPNLPLDCALWLEADAATPPAFPHPIPPGRAMALAFEWARRSKLGKSPTVFTESVRCPKTRCVEPDDCWYHLRVDDAAATTTSHLLSWIEVHAQTGDLRWEAPLPDGGYGYLYEPAKK